MCYVLKTFWEKNDFAIDNFLKYGCPDKAIVVLENIIGYDQPVNHKKAIQLLLQN